MAQILVDNLNPIILKKLETLAKQHGRYLQEELKHILQQAAETATHYPLAAIWKQLEKQ